MFSLFSLEISTLLNPHLITGYIADLFPFIRGNNLLYGISDNRNEGLTLFLFNHMYSEKKSHLHKLNTNHQ